MSGSPTATQSTSAPHRSERLLRLSLVVSKLRPPMKGFTAVRAHMTALGGVTSTMLTQQRPWAESYTKLLKVKLEQSF